LAAGESDIKNELSRQNRQSRDDKLDFGFVLAATMPGLAMTMSAERIRVVELLDTPGRNEAGAGGGTIAEGIGRLHTGTVVPYQPPVDHANSSVINPELTTKW
jgi:hypothetical protein